jgi:hypothetical protein
MNFKKTSPSSSEGIDSYTASENNSSDINHAPQFVDDNDGVNERTVVSAPSAFINCSSISAVFLGSPVKNTKNKGAKREIKRKVVEIADQIGTKLICIYINI